MPASTRGRRALGIPRKALDPRLGGGRS
jgi:hypothetical protein